MRRVERAHDCLSKARQAGVQDQRLLVDHERHEPLRHLALLDGRRVQNVHSQRAHEQRTVLFRECERCAACKTTQTMALVLRRQAEYTPHEIDRVNVMLPHMAPDTQLERNVRLSRAWCGMRKEREHEPRDVAEQRGRKVGIAL